MISKAKQDLLKVMESLYPRVQIVYYLKATLPDGSKLRRGYDTKQVWGFEMATTSTGLAVHHWKAEEMFASVIRNTLNREPLPGEIRVAFRPVLDTYGAVFVDDIIRDTPANILIETSPENWQGHFILSRPVSHQDATKIQKHVIMSCTGTSREHGDPGAASPKQARRFPEGRFLYDDWREPLDVDNVLSLLSVTTPPKAPVCRNAPIQNNAGNWTQAALEDLYARFNTENSNLSEVDMSFALYLLSKGMDKEFVGEAIENVSPNVHVRHPSIDGYLLGIIEKSLLRLSQ
jgi:hypothetical protein